jgi:putative membrane protein
MEQHQESHIILSWLVSGLAVFLTAKVVPGFDIKGFFTACFAALIIGIGNAIVWPILFFLTLPINILTLGLFTFVINGAILKIAAAILPGFELRSWWSAIFGSIVLSIVGLILHYVLF